MRLKINRTAVRCLLLLFIATITSPLWLNWLANTVPVKSKLAVVLTEKSKHQIKIKDFHVRLFPQPKIQFSDITFSPADIQGSILVRELGVGLHFFSLLKGQFIVDRIFIQAPEFDPAVTRNLFDESYATKSIAFALPDPEMIFSLLPEDQEQLSIEIKNVQTQFFRQLNGSLTLLRPQSTIAFDAVIDGLSLTKHQLSSLGDIPVTFSMLNAGQVKLAIALNRRADLEGHLSVVSPALYSSAKTLIFKANQFNAAFSANKETLHVRINPFKTEYPMMNFGMELSLQRPKKESRLDFSGVDVDVQQVRSAALAFFSDSETVNTLFDVVRSGKVPQVKVSLNSDSAGALLDQHNLTLSGSVKDGTVKIPETDLMVQGVEGRARVNAGVLHINASQGLIGQSRINHGVLDIDLMNFEDYPFTGSFDLDADLSELPATLMSLLPDTLLAKELERVKTVSGRCSGRLDLLLETGSDELDVRIQTRPFSATGTYDRIPGLIEIDEALFSYYPDDIRISNASGVLNGSRFSSIDARVELRDTAYFQIKKGSIDVRLEPLIPWLMQYSKPRQMISPANRGAGRVKIGHIQVSGPVNRPEEWQFHAIGKGDGIHLSTNPDQYDIASLSCDFNLKNSSFHLADLSGTVNTARLLEYPESVGMLNELKFPVSIRQGDFKNDSAQTRLKGQLFYKNGVQLLFDLTDTPADGITIDRIEIVEPEVSSATIQFSPQHDFSGLKFGGRLNTDTLAHIFNPDGSWASLLTRLTQNKPMIIESHEQSQFLVTTAAFSVNTLLSSLKSSSELSATLPKTTIRFKGDTVIYKQFAFKDVDSKIDISPHHVYVRVNRASLCDLNTRGYFSLKDNMVYADMPFSAAEQVDIQSLISCLFGKEKLMDGRYTLNCHLSAGAPAKTVSGRFNGNVSFNSYDGRIYKLTLLSRILSVLNVSKVFKGKIPDISQEGFAYNDVSVEADIKDSTVFLKKAVIDGRDMTLIFAGTVDVANDNLNLDCLVAPFKTVDMIIEKIPIINTLFSGRLISVPVKITGRMSDPTVVPLHPASVGKGLVDMMTNILKAPVRIFDKFSPEDKDLKDE